MAFKSIQKPEIATISNAVKVALQNIYGERLVSVLLYGSFARGEEKMESDIDFLYVLKDENVRKGHEIRFSAHVAADLSLQFGISISLHPTSAGSFEQTDRLFYQNIKKEGIFI